MDHWGLHYSIDLCNCNHEIITDPDAIFLWVTELVDIIDMKAYGNPQIVKFGEGNKTGYTCVQLIETSNICAHFSDETNTAFIDVFSCKEFDINVIKSFCEDFFSAVTSYESLQNRG